MLLYVLRNANNNFLRKIYRQIGISMGTYIHVLCSLVADLLLVYCKREIMTSLSDDNQADILIFKLRYLDDGFNIDYHYFVRYGQNKFILLDCNSIKLILQIPNPIFGFTSICFIKHRRG